MNIFQWIMLPILVVLTLFLFGRLKKQPWIRVIVLLIMGLGMVFLIQPEWSTEVANFLGIGRGVDLLIYLSMLGLTLACILLYVRTVELDKKLEALVRQDALKEIREEEAKNNREDG
ncbi:MAG: DUF2304 domain-containing protein [Bacteroidota bacterium]